MAWSLRTGKAVKPTTRIMKKKLLSISCLLLLLQVPAIGQDTTHYERNITLTEAIALARAQSVDAAVALNELKTAYWEYRTFRADLLPEVNFTGTLPNYNKSYSTYQNSDGSYTFVRNNTLGLSGELSINQNIWFTGGTLSLTSSLDYVQQLGKRGNRQFMSVPIGLELTQPIFGVNNLKWNRRIEPVRYAEAKAEFISATEEVTMTTITYFFNLLLAKETLGTARQNKANADRLYEVAIAKRKMGADIGERPAATQAQRPARAGGRDRGREQPQRPDVPAALVPRHIGAGKPEPRASRHRAPHPHAVPGRAGQSPGAELLRPQHPAPPAGSRLPGGNGARQPAQHRPLRQHRLHGAEQGLQQRLPPPAGQPDCGGGVSIPLLDWGKRRGQVKVAKSNRDVVLSQIRQEQMNFNQNIFLLVENFNNQAQQLNIAQEADDIAERR